MNRKPVVIAETRVHPYVLRKLPNGVEQIERLETPVRRVRYPDLAVDYDTRELIITDVVRVPLETVGYYQLEPEVRAVPPPVNPASEPKKRGRKPKVSDGNAP